VVAVAGLPPHAGVAEGDSLLESDHVASVPRAG
jgi:hypothetical protein